MTYVLAPADPPAHPGSGLRDDWSSSVYVISCPGGWRRWTWNAGGPRQRPGAAVSAAYSAWRYRIGVCTSVISTVGIRCEPCGADHAPQPSTPWAPLDMTADIR